MANGVTVQMKVPEQSKIANYDVVYDTAVIKNTPLENLSGTGINNDTAGDYSIDGASTKKSRHGEVGTPDWSHLIRSHSCRGRIKTPADVLNKTAVFTLLPLSVNDNKMWIKFVDAIDNFLRNARLQQCPINMILESLPVYYGKQ